MKQPRLRWVYADYGRMRAARWTKNIDVRLHRPQHWWRATAGIEDYHPISGRKLKFAAWFIVEYRGQ